VAVAGERRPVTLIRAEDGQSGDRVGGVRELADDGLFAANLDPANLKLGYGRSASRRFSSGLRRVGLSYEARRRPVACRGRKEADFPYRYLGADDRAGPNYTVQPAVDSYYRPAPFNPIGPR
jgi:hypothetical protein